MTKREQKLNRLWNYFQKVSKTEDLQKFNMRAFLYGTGRLSYEEVLVEFVAFFFGKELNDPEVVTFKEIMEGKKNG